MTISNSPEEPAFPVTLPPQAETALTEMVSTPGCDFAALTRAAGLDPARDFRGADLRGVDFGTSNLSGFDFSGADLLGCDLSQAKFDRTAMIGARSRRGPRYLSIVTDETMTLCVACSLDGKLIVSGGLSSTACLWNSATGEALGKLQSGHEGRVTGVAFSPDGNRIISGSSDCTVQIWDATTCAAIGEPLSAHKRPVHCVAFSSDGKRVISGSEDNTLRIWNVSTRTTIGDPLRGHEGTVGSAAFSPDGRFIVSGSHDSTLRLWDANTGKPLGEAMRGHEGRVASVAFSPDGNRIVSGGHDRTLRLWDANERTLIGEPFRGHTREVDSVAYSPDGKIIVSGSADRTLRLLDAVTGGWLGDPLRGHEHAVTSVAFSPDGNRIVSGGSDGRVIVWFLDPPVHQVFVTTRPEDEPNKRKLLDKLFAHPEMMKRNVVESVLDPMTHPRPDEGARDALENSVAALFIVGDKDLAFMQHGELDVARRLQRKTGRPRIIPIFTSSAIPTEPPDALKGYHFVHMPLDKPQALNALVEAICQAVDSPSSGPIAAPPEETVAVDARETQQPRSAEKPTNDEIAAQRRLKIEIRELEKARKTGNNSIITKLL